ncbi:hypothetical protein Gpo141_00010153 [Globisporangium polare]
MFPVRSQFRESINASIFPTAVEKTKLTTFHDDRKPARGSSARWEFLPLFSSMYNWSLWAFIFVLVTSQLLGVIWNSSTTHEYSVYGRDPALGTVTIEATNDIPYTDRSVACVLVGRQYKPVQLQKALMASTTTTIDTTGTFVHGYRVIARNELTLDSDTLYVNTCDAIASTLDNIINSCTALGYNVTDDMLRIVDGIDSKSMKLIPNSLPVLIMPFWDKAVSARYAIPGWDGSACVFRLDGYFELDTETRGVLRTTTRAVREARTIEWLERPGGSWRNGWYEDLNGSKWYSDLLSTNANASFSQHVFDTATNAELDCSNATECSIFAVNEAWGSKMMSTTSMKWYNSVTIENGTKVGLYWYETYRMIVVTSEYDLETLISNIALGFVMFRWLVCMAALQNGHRLGVTQWCTIGIGSMSCARNFHFLPIVLMPRLKTTLAAFFTTGCKFEGNQSSLSENWFVMYPAICEFMLFYYSILNMVAKMLRRRVSDHFFGPTLIFLCLLHYLREEFGQAGWFHINGRVTTLVQSAEFSDLRLFDFLKLGVALRLNGNVTGLFALKLVVVATNVIPLFVRWQSTSVKERISKRNAPCDIEKALAIRAPFVGGLGRSDIYDSSDQQGSEAKGFSTLSSYEIVRLGYVVVGGKYLLSIADWHTLFILSPARYLRQPPNFRVTLFTIIEKQHGAKTRVTIDDYPHVCRLNDPRLRAISVLDITVHPFN